jgi:hypothetical protein
MNTKGSQASTLYPYTRENPDLVGYAAVAAGTIVGFFAVVFLSRVIIGDGPSTPSLTSGSS